MINDILGRLGPCPLLEREALKIILNEKTFPPDITHKEVRSMHAYIQHNWRQDQKKAYQFRVIVAKTLEKLAYPSDKPMDGGLLKSAAYNLVYAAKNAQSNYWRSVEIRCRMLAHRLFCDAATSPIIQEDPEIIKSIRDSIESETENILLTLMNPEILERCYFYLNTKRYDPEKTEG